MKKGIRIVGLVIILLMLGACGNNKKLENTEAKKKIRIACNQVSEIVLNAAKKDMEAQGYDPEFVLFSNNIESLEALN